MRHLIIDGQLFQTPAWDRGMGKYSLQLLKSLIANNMKSKTWSDVEILFSSKIKTKNTVFSSIKDVLPSVKFVYLDMVPAHLNNISSAAKNRQIVDDYIVAKKMSGEYIDYFILSLMQTGIAPAFPGIAGVHKSLLFYDLIPLMFNKIYLKEERGIQEYTSKLNEFFKADTYLAISKTVANDLSLYTGIDINRIININGAPIDHSDEITELSIKKPFILMPTGDDLRKNNRRGIVAFEEFNKKHNNSYRLVVTSTFTHQEKLELQKISKNVVFTGNIEGGQLNYLYMEAEALMFPTEYEGLGLPILEAMEHEKPVLCSNISVFREISPTLFEYFDPKDTQSIEDSLHKLVKKEVMANIELYKKVLALYTWEKTAKVAISALAEPVDERYVVSKKKPALVVFCPDPARNILGRQVQLMHAELQKVAEPIYRYEQVESQPIQRTNYTAGAVQSGRMIGGDLPLDEGASGVDAVYHLGNQASCAKTLVAALANPGLVVLYDPSLSETWRSAGDSHMVHRTRQRLEAHLSRTIDSTEDMLISVIVTQRAILTHDRHLYNRIRTIQKNLGIKDTTVKYLPMPTAINVYADTLGQRRVFKKIIIYDDTSVGITHDAPSNIKTIYWNDESNELYDSKEGLLSDYDLINLLGSAENIEINIQSQFIEDYLRNLASSLGVGLCPNKKYRHRRSSNESSSYSEAVKVIVGTLEKIHNER
jgi:glycosyltransferase involved in cell wall biosynthesis